MLYQLIYEATQLGASQFVGLTCSREGVDEWMKFEVRGIEEMEKWSSHLSGQFEQ